MIPPSFVYFTAFPSRFTEDLAQMSRVRSNTRKSGTHYKRQVQTLFAHQ